MSAFRRVCCSVLLSYCAASSNAQAEEQTVSCDIVPAILRTAFAKTYPAATPTTCTKEVERHRTTSYEITGLEGKTTRKALFSPDGKVLALEESVVLAEVPERVQQAVKTKYPDAVITAAEKVTYPAPAFEFYLRHRGKVMQVAVDANGSQVKEVKD
jgi:hypothetical protein